MNNESGNLLLFKCVMITADNNNIIFNSYTYLGKNLGFALQIRLYQDTNFILQQREHEHINNMKCWIVGISLLAQPMVL